MKGHLPSPPSIPKPSASPPSTTPPSPPSTQKPSASPPPQNRLHKFLAIVAIVPQTHAHRLLLIHYLLHRIYVQSLRFRQLLHHAVRQGLMLYFPIFEMQESIQFLLESSLPFCRQGKSPSMYDYPLGLHRRLCLLRPHLHDLPQLVHTTLLRCMRQPHHRSHHSSLTLCFVLCSIHLLLRLPHPRLEVRIIINLVLFHHIILFSVTKSTEDSCSSDSHIQCWQTSGPKFGPTRYPAYRSIHWARFGWGNL
jgi:hypothetical protein